MMTKMTTMMKTMKMIKTHLDYFDVVYVPQDLDAQRHFLRQPETQLTLRNQLVPCQELCAPLQLSLYLLAMTKF